MNMSNLKLSFSESEIQRLFGHEAAEDEDPNRLREYYFKSDIYNQVAHADDLALRILVGHKGIGKSALFKIDMAEKTKDNLLVVLIKPDDIAEVSTCSDNFIQMIKEWKKGLTGIIANKILKSWGVQESETYSSIVFSGLIDFLKDICKDKLESSVGSAHKNIIQKFLDNSSIYVYIDDLDRGWQGRKEDTVRISALLNAVRDISNDNPGVRFRVGLRSDVYYLIRTSDESTDKIEGSVVWHTWTDHEIFVLLVKRIESFFDRDINEKKLLDTPQWKLEGYLDSVMERKFKGRGNWADAPIRQVLMSLTRKRPRDIVKLCTLAAKKAGGGKRNLINTEDFDKSFEEYSQGRLQDTINEFRSELPEIKKLLLGMRPTGKSKTTKEGFVYSTDMLIKKISNIQEQGKFVFANKVEATPKELAGFMYKINFITARKETSGKIIRKYFEENRFLQDQFADFGFAWEVHPAFRWALQPQDINAIFKNLELSADE